MTEPNTRRRIVDLSVIAVSALVLGGSTLLVAEVDRSHQRPPAPLATPPPLATAASTAPIVATRTSAPEASLAASAPVAGLQPAPRPKRRVVVVRRSRAS